MIKSLSLPYDYIQSSTFLHLMLMLCKRSQNKNKLQMADICIQEYTPLGSVYKLEVMFGVSVSTS